MTTATSVSLVITICARVGSVTRGSARAATTSASQLRATASWPSVGRSRSASGTRWDASSLTLARTHALTYSRTCLHDFEWHTSCCFPLLIACAIPTARLRMPTPTDRRGGEDVPWTRRPSLPVGVRLRMVAGLLQREEERAARPARDELNGQPAGGRLLGCGVASSGWWRAVAGGER